MVSALPFPKALENCLSATVAAPYCSSSALSFSAGFLFCVAGLSFRLPVLSLLWG